MITIEKIKELAKNAKQMSVEELKVAFINSFGEEKWAEEEMLGKLIKLSMDVADLLGIDYLPIMFEEMAEDSRIYFKEEYIAINEKYKDNYIECAKCVTHELRHVYQLFYVRLSNDAKAKRMKEELANMKELDPNDLNSISNYSFQEIEIDAFAFTKWYLKNYLDIEVIHPSKDYEKLINAYLEKHFK